MSFLTIFFPYLIYPLGAMASLFVFARYIAHRFQCSFLLILILFIIAYTILFLMIISLLPDHWMYAKPTPHWEEESKKADVAIILGFGYEKSPNGSMLPGEANTNLLTWAFKHTHAKLFLVQEGIWAAARDTVANLDQAREMRRIHIHDEKIYINTLDSAFCTFETLEQLKVNPKKAILIAHELHLQRAAQDFIRVQQAYPQWQKLQLIIPKITDTGYPARSVHWHTRNKYIFKIIELLIARPRDFFSAIPTQPKISLDLKSKKAINRQSIFTQVQP